MGAPVYRHTSYRIAKAVGDQYDERILQAGADRAALFVSRVHADKICVGWTSHRLERRLKAFGGVARDSSDYPLAPTGGPEHPMGCSGSVIAGDRLRRVQHCPGHGVYWSEPNRLTSDRVTSLVQYLHGERIRQLGTGRATLIVASELADRGGTRIAWKREVATAAPAQDNEGGQCNTATYGATKEPIHNRHSLTVKAAR
jgi:hypothetical protein